MLSSYSEYALISDDLDRGLVAQLEPLFVLVKAAKGSGRQGATLAECACQAGMTRKTFQNRYYAWLKNGVMGIADKRKVLKERRVPDILAVFKTYCEQNKESCSGAHRQMMRDFRMGRLMPGIGTWREVYRAQFGAGVVIPQSCPARWEPTGWSYANLMARYEKDPSRLASLAWNRQGQAAAAKFVADVIRTRYDVATRRQLPGGSVLQWDDAWENCHVLLRGFNGVFRPLGFHCYDVATGFHFDAWMKPRTYSRIEGTDRVKGDNLTEQMFRMAFAYHHCVTGINKHGVIHYLEKGTTAIREPVRARIAQIPEFGRLIQFKVSGAMNTPAHKGLFLGSYGGNPQHKSLVEGGHRRMQLEMAHLPANIGRSAAMKPEYLTAQDKHEEAFIAAVNEAMIPAELLPFARKLYPTWEEYHVLYGAISDAVNDTCDHRLEGWIDYHKEEFRDPDDPSLWHPMEMLERLTAVTRERVREMIETDPAGNIRSRKMSRREAWQTWVERGEIVKVPLSEMQYFLDPRDARELTVTAKRTIRLKDAVYFGKDVEMVYDAVVIDRNGIPKMLAPGEKVRVYFNCWGELQNYIWVADMDDKPLGMASLKQKAFWADQEAIETEAKRKLIDQAQLLHDTRARHFDAAAEKVAMEWSQELLVKAAGTVKAKPAEFKGVKAVDVLAVSEPVALPQAPQTSEDDDKASFLARMNRI